MLSSADKVKGQGVGSAYLEQVALVKSGLSDEFAIVVNDKIKKGLLHYHTIDLKHFVHTFLHKSSIHLGYVHFLPETLKGSIKLPRVLSKLFDAYVIRFYKRMDYLVTVNPYFIDLLAQYGIEKNKVHYIPNFVSEKEFYKKSTEEIQRLRRVYGIDEHAFTVLGVGQVQTRKGVLDFIDVANQHPDKTFIWAGGFSFGKITDGYKELKAIVESPPPNVIFLGIIDREEMNNLYNISNLLFMPSYNELFPMSILEAMSVNVPILLRDLDIYNVILDGYYLKSQTNDGFSTCIEQLSDDKEFYDEAVEASCTGSCFYSRAHVLDQWRELYTLVYESE